MDTLYHLVKLVNKEQNDDLIYSSISGEEHGPPPPKL